MLLSFSVIALIQAMDPVHGPQASQVRHPLALQVLEVWEILFPGAWVIHLVQEDDSDTGEVAWRVLVVQCPMLAETTVLPSGMDHVGPMFGPPRLEPYTRSCVLLVMEGTL